MSMIKIACPSCKTTLHIPEQTLRETQGRVECDECQHVFKLVKKKKNPEQNQDSKQDSKNNKKAEILDKEEPKSSKSSKFSKKSKQEERAPLNYRIPKAEAKTNPQFADVNQGNMPFNLMDNPAGNLNIPQVSIKPSQMNAPTVGATGNPDQQNNITIHTDSLVFTLMGDGTQDMGMNPANPNANSSKTPVIVPTPAQDLNWTIAVIAALIVLIMQLFYWVMLWK